MARRANGEGSLRYRRSEKRWEASYYIQEDGVRKRKSMYGRTKGEAREKMSKALAAYEERRLITSAQTVSEWMEHWYNTQKTLGNLKPTTLYSYRHSVDHYISPKLGHLQLAQLNPEVIQLWINELVAHPFTPKTVMRIYGTFHSSLKSALKMRKLAYDPCAGVTLPKVKRYNGPVLSMAQAKRLVEAAVESPLYCMLVVAIATTMRKGELRALHWDQVDLERGVIAVQGTAYYLPDEKTGKHQHQEGDPKSEAGIRDLSLPAFATEALRTHRAKQNERRLICGKRWQDRNLVFCTMFGNYYNLSALQNQFKRLLKAAGLPQEMRFHDLRHSAATILFAMKVNPKIVQRRLGHSDITTTLRLYGQVTEEMDEATMKELDQAYREGGAN